MTHTIKEVVKHSQCKKCGLWFPVSRQLTELIQDGIIMAIDVNLCTVCAEQEADEAQLEQEMEYMIVF